MRELAHRRNRPYLLGAMLCALLFVFALAAKTAPYHTQHVQAKHLASTKVKQSPVVTAPAVTAPVARAGFLFFVPLLLLLPVAASVMRRRRTQTPAVVPVKGSTPRLTVRPPPTI